MRRVAITGLGVISAIGTGTSAFFNALLSAHSGIRAVDIPFPTGTESVLAGAIDFDPDPHFPRARLLTMDRVSQFALVAGREAMSQAGLGDLTAVHNSFAAERFGVSLGTGSGGASSTDVAYTALLEQKVARLRPMADPASRSFTQEIEKQLALP